MTKFADHLYDDLMRQHGSTLADTRPSAASRRHIASRGTIIGTGAGGIAVAATAGVLVTGGGAPAYALTTNHDHTVTLAVYQASGIAQANARLRQLGDNVVVLPVGPGCPSISTLPRPAELPKGKISVDGTKSGDGSITVNAQGVPAGDIMVVAAKVTAQGTQMAATLTASGAHLPSCVSIPSVPSQSGPNVAHLGTSGGASGGAVRGSGSSTHVVHVGSGRGVPSKN
jgi:hypothetical protein